MAFNFLDKFKKKKPGAAEAPGANGAAAAAEGAGAAPPGGNGKAVATGGGSEEGGAAEEAAPSKRDIRKARSFFMHAETVADSRQYDYAIELYLRGLAHEPDNMDKHAALRDVSLKRKVSGGRPAGFRETLKLKGRDPVERLLGAEKLMAKDPLNLKRMLAVMEAAVNADAANNDFNLAEVAYWVGEMILEKGQTDKPPSKEDIVKVRDLYSKIGVWDKAVAAGRLAIQMDPSNEKLVSELRDLEAEQVILAGKYNQDASASVRDMDKQKALLAQDTIVKTPVAADEIIVKRRAEYEDDPKDMDKALKLIEALVTRDADAEGEEAIKMLTEIHEQTGQYRFKERIGDIKMRAMTRKLKDLKAKYEVHPEDSALRKTYEEAALAQLTFELQEYTERVQNYPTDLSRKFELGRRLFHMRNFDEAIGMFQQAKADPKYRSASYERLGRCYLQKDWLDEAVETLTEGLENHKTVGDKIWLELAWTLIEAHERLGARTKNIEQIQKAVKLASTILQTNIEYRDVKTRVDKLRQLLKSLQTAAAGGGPSGLTPPPPTVEHPSKPAAPKPE